MPITNQYFISVQVRRSIFMVLVVVFFTSFKIVEYKKRIRFCGFDWEVKSHDTPEGPGPNYFSDSDSSVWVDASGKLHLRLRNSNGKWWCAEVIGTQAAGLGTLEFHVEGLPKNWDPQCVLGLFTWSTEKVKHHGELDVEYSSWGEKRNPWNLQFVIQPHKKKKNKYRFTAAIHSPLTHQILISRKAAAFSTTGTDLKEERFVVRKRWDPKVPVFPRINLWLYKGISPAGKAPVEVVISSYKFLPL